MFAFLGICVFIFHSFGSVSAAVSEKCTPESILNIKNRDNQVPSFPLKEDRRQTTFNILNANKVLQNGLQHYLRFREEDLGVYLNEIIERDPIFKDEYGQVITSYYKIFEFIWSQYNETLCENYAMKQFENDKLDLCSVARYLSHQPTVQDRGSIMKRMGDALGYKCHPCTPYKRKQYLQNIAPNTDDISPEGVSPEESLRLCKGYNHSGQQVTSSPTALSTKTSTFTSMPTTITAIPTTTTTKPITTAPLTEAPEINETVKPTDSSLFDYTPCNKSRSNGEVICDQIPLVEVQKVFERTALPRLAFVKLTLRPSIFSETFIPKDVFGTKKTIGAIWIEYPPGVVNRSLSLQVDEDAFRSTKSYTNTFTINIIDCTLLDLGFLSGFDQLTKLIFTNIFNMHHCLPSLPPLPRLTELDFDSCTGMNHLDIFPTLTNGLNAFNFYGNVDNSDKTYNDETVDRILDWLLLSSANTLGEMTIVRMKQVTRVPDKIASFKSLSNVWLYNNNISTIKSGAFSFSVPVSKLNINDNGIKKIEPGAFQGDFTDGVVEVYSNNLTRFEESVFGPILQQMASGKGFINAFTDNGNPIDCSEESICHLAWLRRFKGVSDFLLECSNGTSFEDLQPSGFNHCPLL